MKLRSILGAVFLVAFSMTANAQLEPFTDYDVGEAVYNVTTVKIDANMGDDYLEGIRETWVASNKVAKELGQIEDFHIFTSTLPASGDWNLMLVIKYSSLDDLKPSKAEYDKFMDAWGRANEDKTREISKNYPAMRQITGEYQVRELTMK